MKKLLYSFIIIFTFAYIPSLSGMNWLFKGKGFNHFEYLNDLIQKIPQKQSKNKDAFLQHFQTEWDKYKDSLSKQELFKLFIAAVNQQILSIIETLHNFNTQLIKMTDEKGNTALHYASANPNASRALIQKLLIYGSDINATNKDNETPLYEAVNSNSVAIDQLIAQQANLDIRDKLFGNTPLYLAALQNKKKIAEKLLKAGANPNVTNNENNTPLHVTTSPKLINILCHYNANVNAQNKKGYTPLHNAIKKSSIALVQTLINQQTNLELKNNNGDTPLALATKQHSKALLSGNTQEIQSQKEIMTLLQEKLDFMLSNAIQNQDIENTQQAIEQPADVNRETSGEAPGDISIFPIKKTDINPPENNPLNQQPNKPWKKPAVVGSGILGTILAYVGWYKVINEQKIPMYLNQDELASIIIAALHDKKYKYALDTALANPHACNAIARDCDSTMQKHLEYLIYSEENNLAADAAEAARSMNLFTRWIEDTISTKLHYLSQLWHLINEPGDASGNFI